MKIKLLFTFVLFGFWGFSQQNSPAKLHKMLNDVIFSDPVKAEEYANKELELAQSGSEDYVIALIDVATCAYYADDYDNGEALLLKALGMAKKISFEEGIAWASFHLGDIRILEGNYGTAIQYLNKAYDLFKSEKNAEGQALSLNAIGLIYLDQEDFQKARTYFHNALKSGNDITHGDSYTNLAELYLGMEAYDKANQYAMLAKKHAIINDDDYVKSTALDVLGSVAMHNKQYYLALEYFKEALALKEAMLDQKGTSDTYLKLAACESNMNRTDSIFAYTMRAYLLADEVGAKKEIKDAAFALSKYYAHRGSYDSAFFYQNQFVQLNEELMNEQVQKKIAQIESEKATRENEHRIAILENQKKLEHETTSFYLLLAGVGLIVLGGGFYFSYYRYKSKKKSVETLEAKNAVIEEQNNSILESIRYAQRLQEAILPDNKVLQQQFNSFFALYLPKDIVAGDFYWFEKVGKYKILACCDSTGHGVPGAMVSVVCSNALNRAVIEMGLTEPGKILDETRLKVIESLNKSNTSEGNVKDGMDISLISINEETNEIHFAGAQHTLWVYRKETKTFDFYKGDKQPIGVYDEVIRYNTQKVDYSAGDRIFMFTDGYADQFGGPQLKKLKNSSVRHYLSGIQDYALENQLVQLETYFNTWKHGEEQVDDVTVLGLELF